MILYARYISYTEFPNTTYSVNVLILYTDTHTDTRNKYGTA